MKTESRSKKIRERALFIRSLLIVGGPMALLITLGARGPGITDNPKPYSIVEIWVTAILCGMSCLGILHWALALDVEE